jgi:putative salt-induced outer membrane protein
MKKLILISGSVFSLSFSNHVLLAAEEPAWKSSVELGIVSTSGNTETQTINAKAKTEHERERWRHSATFEALKSSDGDTTTAERYFISGQSNYKYSKNNYSFVIVSYEDDRFSGYDYRASEAIGYGRRLLDQEDLKFDLEAGPGARQSKLENDGTDNETILRAAAKLFWGISVTSKFTEDLSVEAGEDSTVSKSVSGLTSKVNGNLATKITYTVKHTSDVPQGIKNRDTETAVTLVYSF